MNNFEIFSKASNLYNAGEYNSAFEEFLKLAEKGDAAAMMRVASMYGDGRGVDYDLNKCLMWDKRAAEAGERSALLNIGITYRNIGDAREAKCWLEKAIALDDGEAALALAKMYMISDKEVDNIKEKLTLAYASKNLSPSSREEVKKLIDELKDK